MIVLSHRGWWIGRPEQNRDVAFRRSFEAGFGIETDLRDRDGSIVISHDMAGADAMPLPQFLDLAEREGSRLTLALNVKADGLQSSLAVALKDRAIADWFVFDMSVPDTLGYRRLGMPFFTRESEVEPDPPLYADAAGVWMDQFFGDWIEPDHIARHLDAGKRVALVSPELHGRDHRAFWDRLARSSLGRDDAVMLCTDFPDRARGCFND